MVLLPLDCSLKTFVCNPGFCQNKFYSAFSGCAAKLSPSAFFMLIKPFVQIFSPADIVLRRTSRTYRLLKVQEIYISCYCVCHFFVEISAIWCRIDKLSSPALFNYHSISSSQLWRLPLLLLLLLSILFA